MRPPPPEDGGSAEPPDRIVLVNPLTQGMVVLQGNPELLAELLSGREGGGPPPASRASIEAMKTVEVGKEEEEKEAAAAGECPVCLDELAGAEAVVVKEMPCRHRFHGLCIEKWLGMHGSCPVCRFRMPAEEEGGSKKGGGGGGGGEEGEADGERRRRRREVWVTISFRRGESRDRHQDEAGDAGDREAD
ncbi:putative E3 ubiquitin-protein ligase MPSR1 [Cocos nucifera]|uniref:RING-type E3 ubiquitin transferase n=1 Tax=Cocos nucifera TaxID=13894 RepID=A0A8K0NB67_COCNU|nr:putative E3 ubiquitin-protein ligase MPSR1 [Cocos nucifera]